MRFTWTVAGDDPDYNNCKAHGIDGLFAPMFDGLTTNAYLRGFQSRGFKAGLYVGHNWLPHLGPIALADAVCDEYTRLTQAQGGKPALKDVRLMMNMEQHEPAFIAATLRRIRSRKKYLGLSWSPEGMQGGWMSPEFVKAIVDLKVRVVPQAFTGDMTRRESDQVMVDLLDRGFTTGSISIFYDAAQLGADWNGYAFTEGRLPRII